MAKSVLIVDDDVDLTKSLARSFTRRGFNALISHSTEHALRLAQKLKPEFVVVDLRMSGASGLACVRELSERDGRTRIVVLTGYASITTAVEAIKSGACYYLAKPANVEDIITAFGRTYGNLDVEIPTEPTSLKEVEWERISKVLIETNYNISETARQIGMARRNLQRRISIAETL